MQECGGVTALLSQQGGLSGGPQSVALAQRSGQKGGLWGHTAWAQIPTLLPTCVNLGQFLNLGTKS